MRTLAVTVLVLLINGCTSVAYVENGGSKWLAVQEHGKN